MTTQQQYQFKGTYIEQIQRWVRSELGEDAWPRYFGSEGGVWTHGVLPNAWYDAEVVDRALRTLTKDHGLDYSQTIMDLAARTSRSDLPTVYRVFFRVMSPSAVFRFMPQLWRAYCMHGEMTVLENTRTRCVVDTVGIPPWLAEFTRGSVRGFMGQVVTLAGGREPKSQIRDETLEPTGKWAGFRRIRCDVTYQV